MFYVILPGPKLTWYGSAHAYVVTHDPAEYRKHGMKLRALFQQLKLKSLESTDGDCQILANYTGNKVLYLVINPVTNEIEFSKEYEPEGHIDVAIEDPVLQSAESAVSVKSFGIKFFLILTLNLLLFLAVVWMLLDLLKTLFNLN